MGSNASPPPHTHTSPPHTHAHKYCFMLLVQNKVVLFLIFMFDIWQAHLDFKNMVSVLLRINQTQGFTSFSQEAIAQQKKLNSYFRAYNIAAS